MHIAVTSNCFFGVSILKEEGKYTMQDRIYEILAAELSGEELTGEEMALLDKWLTENDSNNEIRDRLKSVYNNVSGTWDKAPIEVEKSFYKNQILFERSKQKKKIKIFSRFAYAASFVAIVSLSLFLLFEYGNIDNRKQEIAEKVSDVKAGSSKAVLLLADGEKVNLDDKSNSKIGEQGAVIENKNSTITYTGKEIKSSEKIKYNSVLIPRGGEYQVVLEDGTRVYLNSESKLKYPVKFTGKKRVVNLVGEGYFEVTKDAKRPFIVRTQGVEIKVLGTSFNVNAYKDEDNVYTTLVEGKVSVGAGENSGILTPGKQAVYNKKSKIIKTKDVDVKLYTSWKDGYYAFENEGLEDMMNIISRWYDIEVFFMNKDLKKINFSGRVKRYGDIASLLDLLRLTNDVDFELKNRTLIVKNK